VGMVTIYLDLQISPVIEVIKIFSFKSFPDNVLRSLLVCPSAFTNASVHMLRNLNSNKHYLYV
jgi:hypothetical protein